MIHRQTVPLLGAPIDVLGWDDALARIAVWANLRESRAVCLCDAAAVVRYGRDPAFARAILQADLAAPDGLLVAAALRWLGHRAQRGFDAAALMLALLEQAEVNEHGVFLLGSSKQTLSALRKRLRAHFPKLQLVGALAPPQRTLTADEDARVVQHIQRSGAQLVFVGFGCPQQEQWMAEHRGRVGAVMLGVGAALEQHAGGLRRAPRWMRRLGLAWLHRAARPPRQAPWHELDVRVGFVLRALAQAARRLVRRRGRGAPPLDRHLSSKL